LRADSLTAEVSGHPSVTSALRSLETIASPDRDVQVYLGNTDSFSPQEIEQFGAVLDDAEQKRASRFYHARNRHRYVAGRIWLRHLLGAALGQDPSRLSFECGHKGKPHLSKSQRHGLRFNLSHSGRHVIFALSCEAELGIDLENIDPSSPRGRELQDMAPRVFSARELALWRDLPDPEEQRMVFFRAWVRKEAYLKSTGDGLSASLQAIEVLVDIECGRVSWQRDIGNYCVEELELKSGLLAAVAWRHKPTIT
jgi:4'-phosphopantetheinyl transferase